MLNSITARYTEVLYNIMNSENGSAAINQAMSTYPLYVSTSQRKYGQPNIIPTREQLNNKILNYYKYREIGFETVGRFLDELETSLNEIMPYYNQLFYSADQDFNMIYNVDYVRTIDRDRDNTSNTTATSNTTTSESTTSNNKTVSSDTPQSNISTANTDIDNVEYANNISWNKDTGSGSGTSNGSATTSGTANESESTVETTKGNFGVTSAQDLIKKYREIIINIEQQIINDPRISELFMLVY